VSFILDALRKADQQRQRHATPTLLTVQASAVTRKRPAYLAYIFFAAILVGAGLVIGWLRPWQSPPAKTESVVVTPIESTQPKSPPPTSITNEPAPAPSAVAQQPNPDVGTQSAAQTSPVAPTAAAPSSTPESKRDVPARAKPQAEAPARESNTTTGKATASTPEKLAYTPAGDAPSTQPVIPIADLPQAIRQELPAMTISVHAWSSNPAGSMIGINYKILREGDQVAPGLMLDQITQEGAVFTYKGYRFSRGLK